MIFIGNFNKNSCISVISLAKPKNFVVFANTYVSIYPTVESLQSRFFLTMSHWSSGLPVCFPSQGTQVQIPRGYLCETGILLLALSRYIGDPDVIDHFCGLV
jgi:hypothetical protein